MFNLATVQAFVYKNYLVIAIVVIAALVYYYQVYLPNKRGIVIEPPAPPVVVDNTAAMEAEVQSMISKIRGDASWLQQVTEKALTNGVNTETQLRRDAIWMLQQSGNNPNNYPYSTFA